MIDEKYWPSVEERGAEPLVSQPQCSQCRLNNPKGCHMQCPCYCHKPFDKIYSREVPKKRTAMKKPSSVLAILCSDIHLSLQPPIARSAELNWWDVQLGYLEQLGDLAAAHTAPIICAGDLFDKWNSPPELINFAMNHLPFMYTIPGQHDIPHHNYNELHKSAYWTLVEAGRIKHLEPGMPIEINGFFATGFPWGYTPSAVHTSWKSNSLNLAVVHSYIWTSKHCFPGAPPPSQHLAKFKKMLKGFDAACFGDNHSGFLAGKNKPYVINCGGFLRRKIDEMSYKPSVGLFHKDGTITRHFLDVSQDKFIDAPYSERGSVETAIDLAPLLEELAKVSDAVVSFKEAVQLFLGSNDVEKPVKDIIHKALSKE